MGSYGRFGWMIACSTLVMFGLMYLNTYELAHIHFSQTRAWMALVMGAGAVFAVSLWLVRSQATVDDGIPGQHRRHLGNETRKTCWRSL